MSLAAKIRDFPTSVPSREVAQKLKCKRQYVSIIRAAAKRPEYYKELSRIHSRASYKRYRSDHGIRTVQQAARDRCRWTESEDDKLRRLFPTHTYSEIAKKMGLTRSQIAGRCDRLNLKKKTSSNG